MRLSARTNRGCSGSRSSTALFLASAIGLLVMFYDLSCRGGAVILGDNRLNRRTGTRSALPASVAKPSIVESVRSRNMGKLRRAQRTSALFQAASRAALTLKAAIVSSRCETGGHRIAHQAHVKLLLGGLDQPIECAVEAAVIGVLRGGVSGRCTGGLARCHDGNRQIVIDMGVDAGQRELDARDRGLIAAIEHRSPAAGRGPAGEVRFQRAEVQARELHVERGQPRGVGEAAGRDARSPPNP